MLEPAEDVLFFTAQIAVKRLGGPEEAAKLLNVSCDLVVDWLDPSKAAEPDWVQMCLIAEATRITFVSLLNYFERHKRARQINRGVTDRPHHTSEVPIALVYPPLPGRVQHRLEHPLEHRRS